MPCLKQTRRDFIRRSAGLVSTGVIASGCFTGVSARAEPSLTPSEKPAFGCIGLGDIAFRYPYPDVVDVSTASKYGTVLAVCDVDLRRADEASASGKRAVYQDYRHILDRNDIDAVTISTPDHWHAKIAIEAMRAGKDVFCQKPMSLTIDEGKQICRVVRETNRVFQVCTQQRSTDELFLTAVALCHSGRLGKLRRVTCAFGETKSGGPFKKVPPPAELDWNMWLGPAPMADYIPERCHHSFRYWFEYSGGRMTDWGAHHVDIAQWGIGMDESGPVSVEPVSFKFPVEFRNGMPLVDDCFNTATAYMIKCQFPNEVEMIIRDDTDNGILFEGENGRIFVNRGKLTGKPVEELKNNQLPEEVFAKLRKGKRAYEPDGNPWSRQMANFVACMNDRSLPISDAFSQHRSITTCHLANIAMRLGRKLRWDPVSEEIQEDKEANEWLIRPQRKGFEISA